MDSLDAAEKIIDQVDEEISDDKAIEAAKEDGSKKSAKENHELRLRRTQIAAQSRRFYDLWTEYNNQQVCFDNVMQEVMNFG